VFLRQDFFLADVTHCPLLPRASVRPCQDQYAQSYPEL
jgi:hypothetical protein